MAERRRRVRREGFTLIEVLVTVILLALIAAVAFPIVTQQIDRGDPARTATDLAAITSGINLFHLDVRSTYPGGLNDLTRPITTALHDADGTAYSTPDSTKWNGPYLDKVIATTGQTVGTDTAFATGFGTGEVLDSLVVCKSSVADRTVCTNLSGSNYVGVRILGIDSTSFLKVDSLVDGGAAVGTQLTTGKLRWIHGDTTFYLAVPKK